MGNGCVWQLLIRKVVVVVLVCQSQAMFSLPYMTGHLHIIFSFKTHASEKATSWRYIFCHIMLYTASFLACTQVTELSPDSVVLWIPHFLKNKKVHISQNRNDMNFSVCGGKIMLFNIWSNRSFRKIKAWLFLHLQKFVSYLTWTVKKQEQHFFKAFFECGTSLDN